MIEYTVRVYPSGTKYWFLNGQLHREDGPAYEGSERTKVWYLKGNTHRKDGPAVEWSDGDKEWYLKGKKVTEKEHKRLTSKVIEMTVAEINKALGKKVKVVE